MSLYAYSVFIAIIFYKIKRWATVNILGINAKARLALLWLQGIPVKRHYRIVKELFELLAVQSVPSLVGELIKKEYSAAELKLVF